MKKIIFVSALSILVGLTLTSCSNEPPKSELEKKSDNLGKAAEDLGKEAAKSAQETAQDMKEAA